MSSRPVVKSKPTASIKLHAQRALRLDRERALRAAAAAPRGLLRFQHVLQDARQEGFAARRRPARCAARSAAGLVLVEQRVVGRAVRAPPPWPAPASRVRSQHRLQERQQQARNRLRRAPRARPSRRRAGLGAWPRPGAARARSACTQRRRISRRLARCQSSSRPRLGGGQQIADVGRRSAVSCAMTSSVASLLGARRARRPPASSPSGPSAACQRVVDQRRRGGSAASSVA